MKTALDQNKFIKVKKKVKNFFKKIANPKDVNLNRKTDTDEKYFHRDDLKMY